MEFKARFSETDQLGHINHANYFTYMEEARLHFFQQIGLDLSDEQFTVVLVSAKCDFIEQGYFDQTLVVKCFVKKIGNSSFVITNDIIEKNSQQLIAQGEVTVVYFDVLNQKSAPLPAPFREQLEKWIDRPFPS